MYCTKCGNQVDEKQNFCGYCGVPTPNAARMLPPAAPRPLMRSRYNKKIAGVCSGIALYFGWDPTLVRVIWLVLLFLPFPGAILGYIIAWIAMPKEPKQPAPNALVPYYPYPA